MVKQSIQFAIFFIFVSSLLGCSKFKEIWNQQAPAPQTVHVDQTPLPSFTLVFGDDDATAHQVLLTWRSSILSSFQQIKGKIPNFLDPDEIKTLIQLGFLKLDSDPEASIQKALNLLELFGYKKGISLKNVSDLFDWLETHRSQARVFYKTFSPPTGSVSLWTGEDVMSLLSFFGSLISRTGDEKIESTHLAALIQPWLPDHYPHAKAALSSGIDLMVAFFATACGDRVEQSAWNGYKIGVCLSDMSEHFNSTTPIFDFIFGTTNPTQNRENLSKVAVQFPVAVESWFSGHHHPLFPTNTISRFALALDIPPPYAFFELTAWVPKLNSDSSASELSPSFLYDMSVLVQNWILSTLSATEQEKPCTSTDWKNCSFLGHDDTLDRLWSSRYATLVQRKTLGLVNRVALYQSVSEFLIQTLDTNHTGYLSDSIKDLITVAVSLVDSEAFVQNVVDRVLEKPVEPQNTEDTLHSIHREGLSELAAFAADLIPNRDENPTGFLERLQSEILFPGKDYAYKLDKLGITAFLYSYDLIGNLRDDYFSHYRVPVRLTSTQQYVNRRNLIEALPAMLHDSFPDIYSECTKWGFERTCGVIFTEILPSADPKTSEIETNELDMASLTSILIESMMNRCDPNHDNKLSGRILNGFNEKHCMIDASTALALRLMRSNIVNPNDGAETWIKLVHGVPVVRWAAQSALEKGTLHGLIWTALPPASWLSPPATLGSVLSLAAEFMAPDKTKAIDDGTSGPVKSAGDELLYHHELTDHYLEGGNSAAIRI